MKIVVAVDFSEAMKDVVEQAAGLAQATGAELTLLHAAPPDPDFVGYDVGPQTVRDSLAEKFHEEHRVLQETADGLRSRGVDTNALLVQGPTVDMILEEAKRLSAAMIIVGSHGHSRLVELLVGSVSQGVLQASPVPVLVVPTRDGD